MKYFIVSDVHGFYDELMEALNDAGFDKDNQEHTFVCLGDLLDRGHQPKQCLDFVNSLERKILIRGNHEDLLEEMLDRHIPRYHDYSNGTVDTVTILSGEKDMFNACAIELNDSNLQKYLNNTVNYYTVENNIFLHGWFPLGTDSIDALKECSEKDWADARWTNGMEAWLMGDTIKDTTVFCGHWHTSYGHANIHHDGVEFPYDGQKAHFSPFFDVGIVALDACCAFSHKINCYVLEV